MATELPRFSVVMVVYDNAIDLEQNLPAYLAQDYASGYEVIIVNESSTDDTDDVLTRFKNSLQTTARSAVSRLHTTFLPRPNRRVSRQRMALTLGVKAAQCEWIIFSDILFSPSETWLHELAEFTDDSTKMMLGYVSQKTGNVRLQLFSDLSQATAIVGKTERRAANGHKGKLLRYQRGKYDFMVVRADYGHEALRMFERNYNWRQLLGLRLRVFCYNLFH